LALERKNNSKSIVRYLLLLFKLSVSAALLYFLISKTGGKTIINNMQLLNPAVFIASSCIYIISIFFSSLRWKLLIAQPMETKRLFSLYMIGSFFNVYLPGIVGGDAVKAYYLNKDLSRQSSHAHPTAPSLPFAIASVFMDRYIGFSALLFISMIAFPIGFKYLDETPLERLVPMVFFLFLLGSIVVFKARAGEKIRFLFNVYEYFKLYRSKRDILIKTFLYSIIIQILNIFSVYILSKGLSMDISFITLMIFVPIIIVISFIPVSISGIGLREGAFVFLLGTMGIQPALAMTLSFLWFLSVVAASLWGLFEYLRFKAMPPIWKK
jgi:uncharacterized membrane protein YbhN (UPF0104 family)